jgi:hypothetical protein
MSIELVLSKLESELGFEIHNDVSIYLEKLDSLTTGITPHKTLVLSYNPDVYYHPASLLKLFTALAAKETLKSCSDLVEAIAASLNASDNDALGYIVDLLSETSSGTELASSEFEEFKHKREKINDYFKKLGYSKEINLANKCFSFNYYGRDRQLAKAGTNHNQILISDVAKVMQAIRTDKQKKTEWHIYDFLERKFDPNKADAAIKEKDLDYQTYNFIGGALCKAQLADKAFHSKAGWNSRVRHDAAFVKLNNSEEYLIIILTKNLSHRADLIPLISQALYL